MPFDNARAPGGKTADNPDLAAVGRSVECFDLPHPYLLFRAAAVPALRRRVAADPQLRARLAEVAGHIAAPVERPAQGPRAALKRRARRLIDTAFVALAGAPALAEAALAAARAGLAEFAAAASWSPRPVIRSFLDRAEIGVAVALAYDWLYPELSDGERHAVETAIRRHVLEAARAAYADPSLLWSRRQDNCALVSHAGILVAALAALPHYRAPVAALARRCVAGAWHALAAMAPDGAWREGLSYWSLAMRYAGLMVAALESALGDSFGLADRPGFAVTGDFALHATGPFGAAFNFADSEQRWDPTPLAWLAHRFGRTTDRRLVGDGEGCGLPFAAIWPNGAQAAPRTRPAATGPATGPATGKVFESGDLACFRNTWSSAPGARPVYLAIKGGNVAGSAAARPLRPEEITLHAQADAGSFIVDGARHRWIVDLGPDDYDLPGYFDHGVDARCGRRWRYYRTQAAGHNTLLIDGRDQVPNTPAAIVASCTEGDSKWAVIDLSAAYGGPPGSVRRGAALLGRQVVIQDEIGPDIRGRVVWTAHLAAEPVALVGPLARFRMADDDFAACILEPAGAVFELSLPPAPRPFVPADPSRLHGRGGRRSVAERPRRSGDTPIIRLRVAVPAGARRLTVLLLPDCDGRELALPVAPLDHWLAHRPVQQSRIRRRLSPSRSARHPSAAAITVYEHQIGL